MQSYGVLEQETTKSLLFVSVTWGGYKVFATDLAIFAITVACHTLTVVCIFWRQLRQLFLLTTGFFWKQHRQLGQLYSAHNLKAAGKKCCPNCLSCRLFPLQQDYNRRQLGQLRQLFSWAAYIGSCRRRKKSCPSSLTTVRVWRCNVLVVVNIFNNSCCLKDEKTVGILRLYGGNCVPLQAKRINNDELWKQWISRSIPTKSSRRH